MSSKICPKCQTSHNLNGIYCSRSCANSRGPRTKEFKEKVSAKMKGKNFHTEESIRKGILSKGLTPSSDKPNTVCVICNKDTKTKNRKTCSKECYSKLNKLQSQQHPNCGGQKHTHRSKIFNNKGEVFIAESTYEVKLSKILNSLNINWQRPSFFWYTDKKGNRRRYYPDFYLPEFDVYLDPKNEYLIKTDIDKIIRTSKENEIKIVVIGEDRINESYIKDMVGDTGLEPVTIAV